jgi:hypothetical protein
MHQNVFGEAFLKDSVRTYLTDIESLDLDDYIKKYKLTKEDVESVINTVCITADLCDVSAKLHLELKEANKKSKIFNKIAPVSSDIYIKNGKFYSVVNGDTVLLKVKVASYDSTETPSTKRP